MKYKTEYSILAALATAYVVSIFRFQTKPSYVFYLTLGFAALYFIWGMTHHLLAKNFHARIVLEYLLVGLLGVTIISTLLF